MCLGIAFAGETLPSQFAHTLQGGLLGCPVFRHCDGCVGSLLFTAFEYGLGAGARGVVGLLGHA